MSLSLEFGSLQCIASGFVLQMRRSSICAVVCRKSLPIVSSSHFLMRENGRRPFLVHLRTLINIPNPNSTTTTERSKSKSISRSPSEEMRRRSLRFFCGLIRRLLDRCWSRVPCYARSTARARTGERYGSCSLATRLRGASQVSERNVSPWLVRQRIVCP